MTRDGLVPRRSVTGLGSSLPSSLVVVMSLKRRMEITSSGWATGMHSYQRALLGYTICSYPHGSFVHMLTYSVLKQREGRIFNREHLLITSLEVRKHSLPVHLLSYMLMFTCRKKTVLRYVWLLASMVGSWMPRTQSWFSTYAVIQVCILKGTTLSGQFLRPFHSKLSTRCPRGLPWMRNINGQRANIHIGLLTRKLPALFWFCLKRAPRKNTLQGKVQANANIC